MVAPHRPGVRSVAAVWGHPIHPIFVPFPIAFLVGALLTDVGYWITQDFFWARASLWLLGAGWVTGALAGLSGAVDFVMLQRPREVMAGWFHSIGNVMVLLLALVNWGIRLADPADTILPWGIMLSVVIAALLVITGWYGGELSYRYKIGVDEFPGPAPFEPQGRE